MSNYDSVEAGILTEGMTPDQKLCFHREMSEAWRDRKKAARLKRWLGGIGAHHFYLGDQGRGRKSLLFCWTGVPVLMSMFEGNIKKRTEKVNSETAMRVAMRIKGEGGPVRNYAAPGWRPPSPPPPPRPYVAVPSDDVYVQLEKLADLKSKAILTEDEFQSQKAKLLSGPTVVGASVPPVVPVAAVAESSAVPVQQDMIPDKKKSSKVGLVAACVLGFILLGSAALYFSSGGKVASAQLAAANSAVVTPTTQQARTGSPAIVEQPGGKIAETGFTTYADKSGLFQMEVPVDWVFLQSESDTTLDNTACHMVRAAVFAKGAEHSDLDGRVSEGILVSVYLPPSGQIWQTEWASDWLKRSMNGTLQGYSKYQNTTVEPVQLGNVAASTTAVMGEANAISEPEVARLYVGVSQKYLVVVNVAMPSSKRPLFESADEAVRRTFELKVP